MVKRAGENFFIGSFRQFSDNDAQDPHGIILTIPPTVAPPAAAVSTGKVQNFYLGLRAITFFSHAFSAVSEKNALFAFWQAFCS